MKSYLAIVGATGCVGGKAVAAALDAGRGVFAIADDAAALAALQRRHPSGDLVTIAASVASDAGGAALATRLRELRRPLEGVIVAVGGDIERGRLLDQPADALRDRLGEDLLPHLFAARHLLPLLAESKRGGYVLIGGPGAEHAWAGYGQHSVTTAALRMLARVLHDEARALAVRVQMLSFDSPLRTESNARYACDQWPNVEAVARHAVAMTAGAESPERAIVSHAAQATPSRRSVQNVDPPHVDTQHIDPQHAEPEPASKQTRELLRAIISYPRKQDTFSP